MIASIPRHLITLSAVAAAAACGFGQATSATRVQPGAPQWLDQTIYRPDAAALERDADCRVDRRGPE
jgi:hypothetical protein